MRKTLHSKELGSSRRVSSQVVRQPPLPHTIHERVDTQGGILLAVADRFRPEDRFPRVNRLPRSLRPRSMMMDQLASG